MLFLKILAGIVLFFAVLFSLNLKLDIAMLDTLRLRAGLGPVMLTLSPKKERIINPDDFTYEKHQKRLRKDRKLALKKAEKKRLKAEKKEAAKAAAEAEKKAAEEALEEVKKKKFPLGFIIALIEFVFHELGVFVGYFRTEIVALHVTVGGKDAAAIGKTYGIVSQSVQYLLELLEYKTHMKKLKEGSVSVSADFLREKTDFKIHIRLKLRLFSIIKVGCHALVWFIRQKIKEAKYAAPSSPVKKEQPQE